MRLSGARACLILLLGFAAWSVRETVQPSLSAWTTVASCKVLGAVGQGVRCSLVNGAVDMQAGGVGNCSWFKSESFSVFVVLWTCLLLFLNVAGWSFKKSVVWILAVPVYVFFVEVTRICVQFGLRAAMINWQPEGTVPPWAAQVLFGLFYSVALWGFFRGLERSNGPVKASP